MVLVATQVKRRRGTTAENDAFTGAEGEITVDIEKHELRVHDGMTQGGHIIPTNEALDFANKALDNLSQEGEARFTAKANSDLSNIPSNIDYVVESQEPTAENGYTWYRLYKSGLVEQGGCKEVSSGNNSIPMPITMSGGYGTYTANCNAGVASSNARIVQVLNSSTATTLNVVTNSGFDCFWQVSGMSAQ